MIRRVMAFARQGGGEFDGWPADLISPMRDFATSQRPGWQRRRPAPAFTAAPPTVPHEPPRTSLFDEGSSWSTGGPVTITVYARGTLATPVEIEVASDNGGALSKSLLLIPEGPNGSDSFSFTPGADSVATLTYRAAPGQQLPPARTVYSLADPVGHAAAKLAEAAHAILAKYAASKWEMGAGYADCIQGNRAVDGQPLRAVADSGFGATNANPMDMLNWLNGATAADGAVAPPVMRTRHGRRCSDHSATGTWGFWCKKAAPDAGMPPNPKQRGPYNLHDAHFTMVALCVPGATNTGVVFQASRADEGCTAELSLARGRPQARWIDAQGREQVLTAAGQLAVDAPAVISLTSRQGLQLLRVNGSEAGSGSATFAPTTLTQLLVGWGFRNYVPDRGFGGQIFAVITGKGAPTAAELEVLERYLAG